MKTGDVMNNYLCNCVHIYSFRDTCRIRLLIGNNGAMYSMRTQNCINTVILFLYTFHTIWVLFTQCGYFLDWMLSRSVDRYGTWTLDSAIHDVIVFNFFFWGGANPLPRPHPYFAARWRTSTVVGNSWHFPHFLWMMLFELSLARLKIGGLHSHSNANFLLPA